MVGLEVHVELNTRRKMFSHAPSPAHADYEGESPNTLTDAVVLGLPGALPSINRAGVEMAMLVGCALHCEISERTRWDRKNYFYPDMPKAYQISQYDRPLCFDGAFDLPQPDAAGFADFDAPTRRIGIIRAHLEEDAGKLLHEAPGGGRIDHSVLDLNRAGTPLLEIVTQPDFENADEVVLFARLLRMMCRGLGATRGIMQKGHMRFEPNINCHLTLSDGRVVKTPIVEVKNLNSFKSLRGAIEFEARAQPDRWRDDGREMGPGAKTTRGWDDRSEATYVQREKEDAHDYRYFPDPDLPPLSIDRGWVERVRAGLIEAPQWAMKRLVRDVGLAPKEAFALMEEPGTWRFYSACVEALVKLGVERIRAGKLGANWVLGACAKRANETGVAPEEVGIGAGALAGLAKMREDGRVSNQGTEQAFLALCDRRAVEADAALGIVEELGVLIVRDDAALDVWVGQVIAANPKAAEDVRTGKVAAVGRLVGEVMKLAGGKADAKAVREAMMKRLAAPDA